MEYRAGNIVPWDGVVGKRGENADGEDWRMGRAADGADGDWWGWRIGESVWTTKDAKGTKGTKGGLSREEQRVV